jgi:hypothetical protein
MKKLRILVFSFTVLLFSGLVHQTAYAARFFYTVGGDVSSNGKLNMGNGTFPPDTYFSREGTTGDSGVVLYTNSASFEDGLGSETDPAWVQKLSTNLVSNELGKYSYAYFMSKLTTTPITVQPRTNLCINLGTSGFHSYKGNPNDLSPNYLWLDCPLLGVANDIHIVSGQKIIILADEDVIIQDQITVDPGGFFMVVSTDTITVISSVDKVEGIYIAGKRLATAHDTTPGETANALNARGVFVSHGDLKLWRKKGDVGNSVLGETFTFDPSLILTAPRELYKTSVDFTEVEP